MPLEKVVKDFMHPLKDYRYIGENEPVRNVLRFVAGRENRHNAPFVIVVSDSGEEQGTARGFISPPEIVFGIARHFFKGAERIGPIFWEGQLRAECIQAFRRKVGEIMTPFRTCISESEMIMEAIFLFNRHQVDSLPVLREKEVVGILHLEDILLGIAEMVSE
ncbi:MAG: CBS domain-containing protein [Desulfobacterales bacterium]